MIIDKYVKAYGGPLDGQVVGAPGSGRSFEIAYDGKVHNYRLEAFVVLEPDVLDVRKVYAAVHESIKDANTLSQRVAESVEAA